MAIGMWIAIYIGMDKTQTINQEEIMQDKKIAKMYDVEWDEVGKNGLHRQKTGLCWESAETLERTLISNKYGKNIIISER
jgi:hypothetical protein